MFSSQLSRVHARVHPPGNRVRGGASRRSHVPVTAAKMVRATGTYNGGSGRLNDNVQRDAPNPQRRGRRLGHQRPKSQAPSWAPFPKSQAHAQPRRRCPRRRPSRGHADGGRGFATAERAAKGHTGRRDGHCAGRRDGRRRRGRRVGRWRHGGGAVLLLLFLSSCTAWHMAHGSNGGHPLAPQMPQMPITLGAQRTL